MMYFRLNPECYLVVGASHGAIYDLIDEKIYSLDLQETKLVKNCERNGPVMEDDDILRDLKQHRLGNFYSNRPYIQKLKAGSPNRSDEGEPPALHRAFLEINNMCNRDCWFCGYYGIKRSSGCLGCNKWNEGGGELDKERWKCAINELKDLDCRDIFITGGDLTLVWDRTMDILDHAKGLFKKIYLVLHQESLSEYIINCLNGKAELIVQTDDPNVVKTTDSITLLIAEPENWETIDDDESKTKKIDYVIKDENLFPNNLVSLRKVTPVNLFRFQNNLLFHPCLGHSLAINHNGNVTPCPMMRKHILGDIRNRELYTVFKPETINEFWKLNLDKIEKCAYCEFRYSCSDCRALEERLTGRLNGKMLCSYDPNNGEWITI